MDAEIRRLRVAEGRKAREIAVAMARTPKAIEQRLHRLKIVVQPHAAPTRYRFQTQSSPSSLPDGEDLPA